MPKPPPRSGRPNVRIPRYNPDNHGWKSSRKRALLIAVDNYPSPSQLQGCKKDAQALKMALKDFEVRILKDEEATTEGILRAFDGAIQDFHGDLVMAFSGHGCIENRLQMICSVDVSNNLIPLDWFKGRRNTLGHAIFILDCCRSESISDVKFESAQIVYTTNFLSWFCVSQSQTAFDSFDGGATQIIATQIGLGQLSNVFDLYTIVHEAMHCTYQDRIRPSMEVNGNMNDFRFGKICWRTHGMVWAGLPDRYRLAQSDAERLEVLEEIRRYRFMLPETKLKLPFIWRWFEEAGLALTREEFSQKTTELRARIQRSS